MKFIEVYDLYFYNINKAMYTEKLKSILKPRINKNITFREIIKL